MKKGKKSIWIKWIVHWPGWLQKPHLNLLFSSRWVFLPLWALSFCFQPTPLPLCPACNTVPQFFPTSFQQDFSRPFILSLFIVIVRVCVCMCALCRDLLYLWNLFCCYGRRCRRENWTCRNKSYKKMAHWFNELPVFFPPHSNFDWV